MAAALLLHRAGHAVTVFERFDTARPLGSGLMIQPTGLAVLDALGLGDGLRRRAARIDRLFGRAAGSDAVVLDVRYAALGRRAGHGYAVHRSALFDLLHEALAEAGLGRETAREIAGSTPERSTRRLVFADGSRSEAFDLVVDALGHGSTLAPPNGRVLPYGALWASLDWPDDAGFDAAALEQRYRRASSMVGVLPIGRAPGRDRPQTAYFWSLKLADLPSWRERGLAAWKAEAAALWPATQPLLDQIESSDQLTFARYAHRTLASPTQQGLVHIGDAWHSASPQLGQGANMAMLDAYALMRAVSEEASVPAALDAYTRLRRRHVRAYQLMSALFTPVYQSDSHVLPFVRDRLVGPISKLWPATLVQAAMVTGLIGSPLGALGLTPR